MVWAHPTSSTAGTRTTTGEVHVLTPWRLVDYWTWTRTVDLDDYVLT